MRFHPRNEFGQVSLGLLDRFDGGGGTDVAADIFNRAAAHSFGGIRYQTPTVAASSEFLDVVAAKMVAPVIRLVLTRKCLVADGAGGRNGAFVAGGMTRFFGIHIEALIGNGLVTDDAAKMVWVPVGVERIERGPVNRLGTAFADASNCHEL